MGWQQVEINGGGAVTGMDMASDGTMVIRVDVFGAYGAKLTTGAPVPSWSLLTTTSSLPSSAWGFDGSNNWINPTGVYEIKIAPTFTSKLYMMMNGKMYYSANGGSTWTLMSNFPSISWAANENDKYRSFQKKMAVDPNNADVVYIGTPQNGLYVTTNGTSGASATFSAVSGVPTPSADGSGVYPGIMAIVFDPSSGTDVNGRTNRIYVCSYGNGIYTSGDAGANWSHIASSPNVSDAIVVGGNLYVGVPFATGIQEWIPGTGWSTPNFLSDSNGVFCLAVNPFNSSWFGCMGNAGGNLNYTTSGSGGWGGTYFYSGLNPGNPPSDAPWLADTKPGYANNYSMQTGNNWATGACWFDPITANRFWIAWGYGVAYIDLVSPVPAATAPMTFVTANDGLQNTVATCCTSQIGQAHSHLVFAMEDVQFFVIDNATVVPTSLQHGTGVSQYGNNNEIACWSIDWSQSHAGVMAALQTWTEANTPVFESAYSTDYGVTWTTFPTQPTAHNGGCITSVNSLHHVAIDGNSSTGTVYTTDGGSTWSASTGLPTTGWPNTWTNNPQILCNDANGDVYAYAGGHGLYKSTDKGASFSLVNSQNLMTGGYGTTGYNNPHLSAVPGNAGYLMFGTGLTPNPLPQGAGFFLSTNGGTSWTAVSNVQDVWCHGYGAVATGATFPTLWIVGWVKVGSNPYKFGIWKSTDLGSTWTFETDFPAGLYDQPRCITGSGSNAARAYVGYLGSSYMYGSNL